MTRQRIPDEVLAAAHARSRARAERDWNEADRLRSEIESAGWRIVDHGTDFALSPDAPPDVAEGDRVRYGSSRTVPSRLDEPGTGLATVVVVATDWPADVDRALVAVERHAPPGTNLVVVADGPAPEQEAALDTAVLDAAAGAAPTPNAARAPIEVIWTSVRLGQATAVNIGARRAVAPVVILLDSSVEPTGDFVTPLVRALDDPTVAVAGGWGLRSKDLRHFEEAQPGPVDAVEGYCLAFRRDDFAVRGPLDERFTFYRNLDIWWSLVLRDEGPDRPPRRAWSLDLPLIRHEHRGYTSLPEDERNRLSKRNFYRIIDRFGARLDLLIAAQPDA